MEKQKNDNQCDDQKLASFKSNGPESEIESLHKKLIRSENRNKRLKSKNDAYFSAVERHYNKNEILEKENSQLKRALIEKNSTVTRLIKCLDFYSGNVIPGENDLSNKKWEDVELKKTLSILLSLAHSSKNDLLKNYSLEDFLENQN